MDVPYLQSPALTELRSVAHGFFTRNGGVSKGIYASLNCGPGSADVSEDIGENRKRVAEKLGGRQEQLSTLYQVHGKEVITLTKPITLGARPEADAMVTATKGVMLGILTADCVPVLFADAHKPIIGAAHAGWKGALAGVLEATVKSMQVLGATEIMAAIGPAIGQESYEVDAEFVGPFIKENPGNARFFISQHAGAKVLFNLKAYVRAKLARAGVHLIEMLPQDTYADEGHFFSYRRATHKQEKEYGRQISVITLT